MSQNNDVTDVDVVVVGYGPVGQFLTLQLARQGWSVAAVDRWPDFYPFPRAVHFDDEVGRLLQRVGIRPDSTPTIEPYDNFYTWRNAAKQDLLRVDWRGRGRSGWHQANFFAQPDLERELHGLVTQEPNAQVDRGWEVVDVVESGDRVTVTAQQMRASGVSDAGATRTYRGRYVVGCDGANSFVRKTMGTGVQDLGFEFDWLIVDTIPRDPMQFDPPAWQWCDPEHPTTIVPGGPGRRRWEFMRMPNERVQDMNTASYAWSRLAEWGLTPDNAELERHAVYTFRAQWAHEWRKGRLLLAGDAAHLMPPFAGQGMCAGLRDAANLSWRIDRVLRGASSAELLDSYGPERSGHVQYFINFSIQLGNVICVTDPEVAAERDKGMQAALADSSLAPEEPLPPHLSEGVLGGHAQAGFLGVQGRVRHDGQDGLLDDLVGYGWVVLGRDTDPVAALSSGMRQWSAENGMRFLSVGGATCDLEDLDGTYAAWFDELATDVVIVRPDFYVYDAVPADAVEQSLARLRTQLSATSAASVTPVG